MTIRMPSNCSSYTSLATLVLLTGVASAQPPLPKLPGTGPGKVRVETIQSYSGPRLAKPAGIFVYDFAVTPEDVELNRSILNRIRIQATAIPPADERTRVSRNVAAAFSSVLMECLEKTGLPVSHGIIGQPPPDNTLAVQGDFEHIDEGDRLVRVGIGFGAGASSVKAHVELYLGQRPHNVIILELETKAMSSKKPGAVLSMGVGAAAEVAGAVAGAGDQKQTVEGDARRLANELGKHLAGTLKSQGWVH